MTTSHTTKGFTLIEIIVATALFSILMVIGIGAVLNANASRSKAQVQRAANDSLAFIMEDLSRNIRLGESYYGDSSGLGIGFNAPYLRAVGGSAETEIQYEFIPSSDGFGYLMKRVREAPGASWREFNITPPELRFNLDQSGFTIVGTGGTADGDFQQPRVVVRLTGEVRNLSGNIQSPFAVQTTLSQRLLEN